MALFLYSGGSAEENKDLDQALLESLDASASIVTFVPSCSLHAHEDFDLFMDYYGSYGFTEFRMLLLDVSLKRRDFDRALESDLIYFGGGNTFYLLFHLRRSGFCDLVQEYLDGGGMVAGESAGAIVLTNNIATAGFPEFDRDDNDIGIKDLQALDLVSFEFFPHFVNRPRYSRELRRYTRASSRPLVACPDGSGVIVTESQVKLIGDVHVFFRGGRFQLQELF